MSFCCQKQLCYLTIMVEQSLEWTINNSERPECHWTTGSEDLSSCLQILPGRNTSTEVWKDEPILARLTNSRALCSEGSCEDTDLKGKKGEARKMIINIFVSWFSFYHFTFKILLKGCSDSLQFFYFPLVQYNPWVCSVNWFQTSFITESVIKSSHCVSFLMSLKPIGYFTTSAP